MTTENPLVSPKVEELARELEQYLGTGRHMLVLAEGDCETIVMCSCGHSFPSQRPDRPWDELADPWQRHAMAARR